MGNDQNEQTGLYGATGAMRVWSGLFARLPSAPLKASGKGLDWQWVVDRLPSHLPEDQILTHDYLSIAVEFDDGQDITYMWSSSLPVGQVFRCPLPGWDAVETHVVQRSGLASVHTFSDAEALPTTAAIPLVGVVELETFVQAFTHEVQLSAVNVGQALGVDQHLDTVVLEHDILRLALVHIFELVGKP